MQLFISLNRISTIQQINQMRLHLIIFSIFITPLLSFAQPSPKGLQLNEKAPEFSAKDQHGKLITLSAELKKGAALIAVSPEKPENISKTVEKTKASYSVLFDDGLKIMKSYDVAFSVDSNTVEKYKKNGIDFYDANGGNGATLPVPTVYIINKEGIIVFKHFDPDYRKRVTVQEILSHL